MTSLALAAAAELELRRRGTRYPPRDWQAWARTLFPTYCTYPFGARHTEQWEWAQSIQADQHAPTFFAIWPRESAKSTSAQMVMIYLGAEKKRQYVWYVSETQDQADDHVTTISNMLTLDSVARYYPLLAQRRLTKFGHSQAWRRQRLWTAHGLIVDAMGLDKAKRGVKLEEKRPDLIIFDDIDNELDTQETVEKKIKTITKKLLPAGAKHVTVLVAQNLVHAGSVVSRLVDGHETFLHDRIVSGPFKVVEGMETENRDGRDVIVKGAATWEGQGLDYAQDKIDLVGLPAFLSEYQNEVGEDDRLTFKPSWWDIATGRNRYQPDEARVQHLGVQRWQFWDTALKDKKTNDPSACITVELLPASFGYKLTVRHVWEERLLGALVPGQIEALAMQWNRDGKLRGVVVEDRNSGTTSIQTLTASSPSWLAEKIVAWEPQGTKEARAKLASVWCPRNMILLPYPAPWNAEWYDKFCAAEEPKGQLFRFPFAPHDDMVDVFTMAILYLENYLEAGWKAALAEAA